ncbi:MAG: methyltransferase domain-containing protein [Acidimicrobiaceae bacterium]|nr:methyltransferase domain-containing protein [Acidimicrobiaceae bacterium]
MGFFSRKLVDAKVEPDLPDSGVDLSNFEEASYLEANPDVLRAVEDGQFASGKEHYLEFGRQEGRPTRLGGTTRDLKKAFAIADPSGKGLEIGPSHNPIAPKRDGYDVEIVDHLNQDQLREKYADQGVDTSKIEPVDFVWNGEPLDQLVRKKSHYDWIVASHLMEHVPNPISMLQQCHEILKPNGVLSLVVPDKRYCFDYFRPISSTGDLLDAYELSRTRPSRGQMFDHFASAASRDGAISWGRDGKGGADSLIHDLASAVEIYDSKQSEYVDVHCWCFTLSSFELIIADLRELALTRFVIKERFDTEAGEFYVSLVNEPNEIQTSRLHALIGIEADLLAIKNEPED